MVAWRVPVFSQEIDRHTPLTNVDKCACMNDMTYNGREVMEWAASSQGWLTTKNLWPERPDKVEFDAYTYGEDTVLIGWTQRNTAPFISINGNEIKGVGGLITARRYMEGER